MRFCLKQNCLLRLQVRRPESGPLHMANRTRNSRIKIDLEFASPLDQLLTNGLDLNSAALDSAVQGMEAADSTEAASADSVDEVLASVLDEIDIALTVE